MSRIFKGVIVVFLLIMSQKTFTQNYFNSPYTRYLIGDLINNGFAYNRALGGCSVALRPKNQINYLNPASYTNQDTNSFLFQTGFTARIAKIRTGIDEDQSSNLNIDYLAIGFPITKWWNTSIGIAPFSRIQYFFREIDDNSAIGEKITFDYKGTGGLNEFYFGNGFEIGKLVSVGANISYLFGSLDREQDSYLTDLTDYSALISYKTNYIINDFYYKLGIQLHPVIKEKHAFVAGFSMDAATNLNVKLKGSTTRHNPAASYLFNDSLQFNIDTLPDLKLPVKIGFGLSYCYDNMLTITGEYIRQDWSNTPIVASSFTAGLYESYRFGLELNPVSLDKRVRANYLQRIHYSTGAFYTKSYLYNNGKNISEYGFSAGVGLPWRLAKKMFTSTTFNIGYQYSVRGTTDNGLIEEDHHFISVGLTLHDFWFLKPKYD
jgi:hypothetical protein